MDFRRPNGAARTTGDAPNGVFAGRYLSVEGRALFYRAAHTIPRRRMVRICGTSNSAATCPSAL